MPQPERVEPQHGRMLQPERVEPQHGRMSPPLKGKSRRKRMARSRITEFSEQSSCGLDIPVPQNRTIPGFRTIETDSEKTLPNNAWISGTEMMGSQITNPPGNISLAESGTSKRCIPKELFVRVPERIESNDQSSCLLITPPLNPQTPVPEISESPRCQKIESEVISPAAPMSTQI
ncbi:hypothetical protein NPIL_454191, partial [Nephila pilipes]